MSLTEEEKPKTSPEEMRRSRRVEFEEGQGGEGQPLAPSRRPLKIVYFNPTGTLGGAELCLLDVLAGVRESRPDWSLKVLLADDGPVRDALETLDIACKVLPIPRNLAAVGDSATKSNLARIAGLAATIPSSAIYFSKIRQVLKAECPDIVQTNGMKAHLLGAWGARRGVPVVWQMHDYPAGRPLMGRLLRGSRRRGLRVVAVSRSVATDTSRLLGPAVPVVPIYNAIDVERFAPRNETAVARENGADFGAWLDLASGLSPASVVTVRVGLVATYARWKGHDLFLKGAALLAGRYPQARFYIVGGPIYQSAGSQFSREELTGLATTLGLDGRVGFVPHQSDPSKVFQSLDVVVHASTKPEPFGRVIVEGMASGRAVLAIEQGGSAELFQPEVSALGIPANDPEAMAGQLGRLIESKALRERLGRQARAEAVARFDRKRLGCEWVRFYETLR